MKTSKSIYQILTASSNVNEIMFGLEESPSIETKNDTINVLTIHIGLSATQSTLIFAFLRAIE